MRPQMQVGQYVMDRRLGQGGMAEVWLAHHTVLAAPVAVKFLTAPWAGHPELEERFLREAKRQGALDHPNLVKVYGFEYFEGHSFLIMQYIDGESLDDRLVRGGRTPLDFAEILQIASGALLGLGYAHERQIVHRDIKPSNIMLDRSLHAFIGDFGLVMVRDEKRMTRTGTLMGTPLYMSPEQILHPKEVDHRADIYSFGCVLYEMFTGATPFEKHDADTDFHVKMAHTTQPPVPLRQLNPAAPAEVEGVVMKCLEKTPERRFQSCAELREALAAAMGASAARATSVPITRAVAAPQPPATVAEVFLWETPQPPHLAPATSQFGTPLAASQPMLVATPIPQPYVPPPGPPPAAQPVAWRRMLHNPAAIAAVSAVVVASLAGGTYVAVTHNPFGKSGSEVVKPRPEPKPEQGPSGAAMPQPTPEPGPHTTPVVNPGPPPMPQPNADPPPSPPPVVNPTPAMTPLTRVKFRVRLASKISSEASEEGQPVRGMVLAPGSYGACSMDGVVTKAGHSGFIPGRRRAELLFTFYTLHCPNGTRGIDSHVVSFWNSRGQANVDEEGQKVESSNGAKKIVLATAGGAVIGAITGHSKSTTAKGAAAGAGVGVALTSLSGKGKVLSFAPGSVFVVQVSDRRDH